MSREKLWIMVDVETGRVAYAVLSVPWVGARHSSPTTLVASTVATSAIPGASATHGAVTSRSRPPAIMFPQLGAGG